MGAACGLFRCALHGPEGAARGGTVMRRRGKHRVVDIHCHALTPAAEAMVRPHFTPDKEATYRFASDASRAVNAAQSRDVAPKLTDIGVRLAEMDRLGIDVQAVSPSPTQYYYWAEPGLGRDAARLINDRLADIVASHPDRFVALGTVPLQAPDLAVAELRRCVKELGLRGVEISSNVAGQELAHPKFRPFFAAAEDLGILIFLHPLGFTQGERLSEHYFSNLIGNPLESAIAVGHLIFGGVLDRHPGLKICVAHGGGYLPGYIGRMDHGWEARADCRQHIAQPPSHYLRRLYFDTVVFDPDQLAYLVRKYGADHIVLGTDYPFDMAEFDPLGLLDRTPGLGEPERAAIMGGNAMRLLGL